MATNGATLWGLTSETNAESDIIVQIQPMSDEECTADDSSLQMPSRQFKHKEMTVSSPADVKVLDMKTSENISSPMAVTNLSAVNLPVSVASGNLVGSHLVASNLIHTNLPTPVMSPVMSNTATSSVVTTQNLNTLISSSLVTTQGSTTTALPPTTQTSVSASSLAVAMTSIQTSSLVDIGVGEPQWIHLGISTATPPAPAPSNNSELVCTVCNKRYQTRRALREHVSIHVKKHTCDLCPKAFAKLQHLTTHRRTHTGEKPYSCDICGKSFNESGSCKRHIRTHTGDCPYECEICHKRFIDLGSKKKHLTVHTGVKAYKCTICGRAFSRSQSLKDHMRVHTGEKPYACDFCGKTFAHRQHMKSHTRYHTGEKPYRCHLCQHSFAYLRSLKLHLSRHDDIATTEDENLYTRGSDGRFLCDVCLKTFPDIPTLRRHLWLHGTRNYECNICKKTFTEASIFRQHVKTHVVNHSSMAFHCEVCPESFARSVDLKEHRKTHTGETPFICHLCGQAFMFKRMLTAHQKTHTNLTSSYKCHFCPTSLFLSEKDLEQHIASAHSGCCACDICGRSFESLSLLSKHKESHVAAAITAAVDSNTEPYECQICFMRFARLSEFESHKVLHESPIATITVSAPNSSDRRVDVNALPVATQTITQPYNNTCQACGKVTNKLRLVDRRYADKDKSGALTAGHQLLCCEICSTAFSVADGKPLDQNQDAVLCMQCGFTFYGRRSLESHIKRFHQANRKGIGSQPPAAPVSHTCELCGEVFLKLSALRGHLRLHVSESYLTCGVCERLFGRRDTLQKHMLIHGKAAGLVGGGLSDVKPEGIQYIKGTDWNEIINGVTNPIGSLEHSNSLPGIGFVAAVGAATKLGQSASGINVNAPTTSVIGSTSSAAPWSNVTWTANNHVISQGSVHSI